MTKPCDSGSCCIHSTVWGPRSQSSLHRAKADGANRAVWQRSSGDTLRHQHHESSLSTCLSDFESQHFPRLLAYSVFQGGCPASWLHRLSQPSSLCQVLGAQVCKPNTTALPLGPVLVQCHIKNSAVQTLNPDSNTDIYLHICKYIYVL